MAVSTTSSNSLKEYLKRYENVNEEEKKKKKKKKKSKPDAMGVLVVDEDPIWQKQLEENENGDDSADEEKPQIDEDIEVKRMKRLEQIRSLRPYHAISEDGSGWVSISETPKPSNSNNQDFDLSPPRQRRARYDTPSPEPELKPSGSGNEPDIDDSGVSPVADLSPPRKKRRDFERPESPDLSPPRRTHSSVSSVPDLSPPRKSKKDFEKPELPGLPPSRRIHRSSTEVNASRGSSVPDLSPPRKSRKESFSLKEGAKTGLITGQDIKEENAKTKKNDWSRFKEMDPSISGRGADPVYRDKRKGDRISKDEFLKSQKGEEKPKEKKLEWGKGLAQKQEAEAREHELELEKDKPFARTRDDPELDNMLKERLRWGDPMAHLVKQKHSELVLEDLGEREKMKESGFIIPQDIPSHSWIKRRLEAAPNRYGIRPGRHWDGVDRSSGYEKQFFKRTNEKQATEREAYLWSVSDM